VANKGFVRRAAARTAGIWTEGRQEHTIADRSTCNRQ